MSGQGKITYPDKRLNAINQIHEVISIKKNIVTYLLITSLMMTSTGIFTAQLFSQQISTMSGQIFVRPSAQLVQENQILADEPVPQVNVDQAPETDLSTSLSGNAYLAANDNMAGLSDDEYSDLTLDESDYDESSLEVPSEEESTLDLSGFDASSLGDFSDTISRGSAALPEIAKSTTTTERVVKKPIELTPWFGKVNKIYAKDDIATVIDVETGMTMQVKRTGGSNHADVETMTTADTTTLLKIASGSWNWTRRPVIVEIDGHRFAGSLTAMPHAGRDDQPARVSVSKRSEGYGRGTNWDSVKGNEMDGHFDIHFYGSKTHGSHQVDPDHQAAIRKAFRSGM